MKLYDMDQQTRIDEFGVDHSNFSLHDEIEYNFRRAKEKEMQQNMQPQIFNTPQPRILRNMPKINWNDVVGAGIIGMGEGTIAGINRGLNAASFGLYGRASDALFDNIYTNQQNRLQHQAEQVGLGNANRLANKAIDVGSQLISAKLLGL